MLTTKMLRRFSSRWTTAFVSASIALAVSYLVYRLVDPLPPHRLVIAAGSVGSVYDKVARDYARVLALNGVTLEIRNSAGAVEGLEQLLDAGSGVQAALTTFGITRPADQNTVHSLGGVFDAAVFVFYRSTQPLSRFGQFRGKRLAVGMPGTGLRKLILQVLGSTDALDDSTRIVDLDYAAAVDALVAGAIDVAVFPSQLDGSLLMRALDAPGVRLMSVGQAEAIAKTVPGLKHVVLSRGLVSLSRDIPDSDVDLLASPNRLLVRRDLHPALQYLLLKAMREVHGGSGPFNRLGEFPAEQPNDLQLAPTAEAFYRSGPTVWQRYTSFWLTSLLNQIVFFVIPVIVILIPLIGFVAPRLYRWLHIRRIHQLHQELAALESGLGDSADKARFVVQHRAGLATIESAVSLLKVARAFAVDLQLLRFHLRMVHEDFAKGSCPHGSGRRSGAAP